jgi:hypothetical protein
MPSATRIQYELPSEAYLDQLLTDDLILRYVKDNYEYSKHRTEFYDTPEWRLTHAHFSMDVDRDLSIPTVHLARARLTPEDLPGLLHGDTWTAPFESVDTMVDALADRGAPYEFLAIARGAELVCHFEIAHSSKSTTLYLPDRTRICMSFDSSVIYAGGREGRSYELCMDLLFGEESQLVNYCQQIRERFDLPPVLLSREMKAQRLLAGGD